MFDPAIMGVPRIKQGVSKACDEFLRRYRDNLEIVSGPTCYYIVQSFLGARDCGGIAKVERIYVPVLSTKQAIVPEYAWIKSLQEQKVANIKEEIKESWKKHDKLMNRVDDIATEAAVEYLYPYIRKTYGAVNMEGVRRINPYDNTKRLQDKLGRETR